MMAERKPKDPFAEFQDAPTGDPFAEFADAPKIATPSEIPVRKGPSLSDIGGRETGFRPQVEATGMTPEQRQAAVAGMIPVAASLAAGPAAGGVIRGIDALAASAAGLRGGIPLIREFGRSVQSGGLASGLSSPQRLLGGGTAGGLSTAVVNPEEIETGTAIGVLTPAAGKVVRPFLRPSGPSTKEVAKAADAEYTAMRALNESLDPATFKNLQTSLVNSAKSAQYLPSKHTRIANAFNIFKEQAKVNEPVSIDRVDKLRKELAKAANSRDKEERDLAQALVKQLDAFVENAVPASAAHLNAGRDLVTRKSRSQIIDNILEKARVSKGAEPSEIIRNEFYKISRGSTSEYAKKKRQFSAEEQAIIDDIAEGRASINALESFGAVFAPPRILRPNVRDIPKTAAQLTGYGALGVVGQQTGNPLVAAGLAATASGAGYTSRALANRLAMMQADRLRAAAAAGGPVAQRAAPELFPQFVPTAVGNALTPEQVDFLAEQQRINQLGF
jgi:hypothetical protein